MQKGGDLGCALLQNLENGSRGRFGETTRQLCSDFGYDLGSEARKMLHHSEHLRLRIVGCRRRTQKVPRLNIRCSVVPILSGQSHRKFQASRRQFSGCGKRRSRQNVIKWRQSELIFRFQENLVILGVAIG